MVGLNFVCGSLWLDIDGGCVIIVHVKYFQSAQRNCARVQKITDIKNRF